MHISDTEVAFDKAAENPGNKDKLFHFFITKLTSFIQVPCSGNGLGQGLDSHCS